MSNQAAVGRPRPGKKRYKCPLCGVWAASISDSNKMRIEFSCPERCGSYTISASLRRKFDGEADAERLKLQAYLGCYTRQQFEKTRAPVPIVMKEWRAIAEKHRAYHEDNRKARLLVTIAEGCEYRLGRCYVSKFGRDSRMIDCTWPAEVGQLLKELEQEGSIEIDGREPDEVLCHLTHSGRTKARSAQAASQPAASVDENGPRSHSPRRPGPKGLVDHAAHYEILKGMRPHDWSDKSALSRICTKLDEIRSPIPARWANGKFPGTWADSDCWPNDWKSALQCGGMKPICKVLRQRLVEAKAHTGE